MMNNYLQFKNRILSPADRKKLGPHDTTFKSIKSGNEIKRYSVKTSNFLNCISCGITLSSLLPHVTASTSTIVDESYTSDEDVYDAVLNTFFLVLFVIF